MKTGFVSRTLKWCGSENRISNKGSFHVICFLATKGSIRTQNVPILPLFISRPWPYISAAILNMSPIIAFASFRLRPGAASYSNLVPS